VFSIHCYLSPPAALSIETCDLLGLHRCDKTAPFIRRHVSALDQDLHGMNGSNENKT
jgi:hypothetical protein